jgi:segregation and condensation protein B
MEHTAVMDDTSTAGGSPPEPATLGAAIEAILLTVDRPVPWPRLAEALGLIAPPADAGSDERPAAGQIEAKPRRRGRARQGGEDPAQQVASAVENLNRQYEATGRSFRIESVAGGYRVMTLPALAPVLAAFHKTRSSSRLSRAAVETLAVIAYKQPITRAHLEAIRGVACGEVLRSLLDRRLITIKGRAEELGRPILYGTTKEFLDAFGLASLKDLPSATELQITP